MAFELHPQLEADSVHIAMLPLCELRLMTDANYPWLILVPQRENIREIHRLSVNDQQRLMREIALVAERFETLTGADKMNVAALGNMVPQLHIHVIVRFESDPAWPGPIWGVVDSKPYSEQALTDMVASLQQVMV